MAINKNFVVKNGLEVGDQLIHADDTTAKVGIGSTQPSVELDVRGGIAATNTTVSGVSTVQTALRVGSGIGGTVFTALDDNVVGVGTSQPIFLLDVVSPVSSGTTALYVQGDVRFTGDLDVGAGVSIAGLSTFAGIGTFYEGFISAGIATVKQLEVIGFSTLRANVDIAADVGITSTLVVGAGLSVAGISTLTGLTDLNGGLDVTGVSTFANNVDINADVDINRSLAVTGGATVTGLSTFTGNVDINSDVDINRSLAVTGGATVTGLSTFQENVDINADVDVSRSVSITGGLGVTGIGTIGRVKIFNEGTGAAVTATSGIVTYYGDGQYLTNIQSGVGIATTNPTTGYSETVGLGATIITFAGPGVSTDASHAGGTGVTVNAASGIATVYIAGGGSGGGFQTIITKDSTTVGSGGQSTFTSSSGYTSGHINVYVNGSKLNSADFTETDAAGGTIELASAAVEGDIVELENFAVTAITGDVETLITKEEYTVTTASQTVFDLTAEYTSGYIDVYLNGVRLSSSDYTETNSTRVTLATGATFGDVLEFVIYEKRAISELQPIWRNDGVGGGSGGIYTFTSVGIGTSAQTAFVDIYGGMKVRAGVVTIANSASADILRITDGGVNVVSGVTTIAGDLDVNGTGTHDIFGTVSLDNVQVAAGVTIGGTLEVNGDDHSIDNTTTMGNINATGIVTANSVVLSQNLTVGNNLEVTGNLTVNGTTSIIDTTVQEVDLLNIQANSSTPAIGVTQSGAGPIIAAYDGATEVFRINQYGTLGVGCIPNDLQNNFDAVQIGGNLMLNVDSTGVGAGVYMSNNVYRDRTDSRWEYINTDEATQYLQANGEHIWRYAASGTADTAITWSEALRIANDGTVTLGYAGASLYFQNGFNDRTARIANGGASGSSNLRFYTNNAGTEAEELRITPSGNVNIGGNYAQTTYTSQITGTLNVTGNITQNGVQVATSTNSVSTGKAIAMAMIFG
jgi:hypothetical protein|tara:strand:- start:1283 stop:4204 length:2922 start_codon:yes stop_codon:yes gene_type:complete